MSTRATYKIIGTYNREATFYIHHDGYLEGGAVYFWNMLTSDNQAGGYVSSFLRANKKSEITDSHESHGDTEFRYTYNVGKDLLCIDSYKWHSEEWTACYAGNLSDFINQYGIESIKDFNISDTEYSHIINLKPFNQYLSDVENNMQQFDKWFYSGVIGNASEYTHDNGKLFLILKDNIALLDDGGMRVFKRLAKWLLITSSLMADCYDGHTMKSWLSIADKALIIGDLKTVINNT